MLLCTVSLQRSFNRFFYLSEHIAFEMHTAKTTKTFLVAFSSEHFLLKKNRFATLYQQVVLSTVFVQKRMLSFKFIDQTPLATSSGVLGWGGGGQGAGGGGRGAGGALCHTPSFMFFYVTGCQITLKHGKLMDD